MRESLSWLREFGARSVLTHALMAATLAGAVVSAFVIDGQTGVVSFVAFLNFTAGVWIAQSIHSLGNAFTDDDYAGVIDYLRG